MQGSGVNAILSRLPRCVLTDWLMAQVMLRCYYGCRDLESVLHCIKKNGTSLCLTDWLMAQFTLWSGVHAALHKKNGASLFLLIDWLCRLHCAATTGAGTWSRNWLIDCAGYPMLLLWEPGTGVGTDWLNVQVTVHYAATTGARIWIRCCAGRTAPHCVLTDWLTVQVTPCCYYGCRDLESVQCCIKKNGSSLWVNWLIDCEGYAVLLLRVPGPGVGAALHQEECHLTVCWLIDWLCRLYYAATTGAMIGSRCSAASRRMAPHGG